MTTTASGFAGGQFRFTELIDTLHNFVSLIDEVVTRLRETGQLQDPLQQALDGTPELFSTAIAQVIGNIESGEYDSLLAAHQLNDGDPAWEFKSVGYFQARERYEGWLEAGEPLEDGDPEDLPRWKKMGAESEGSTGLGQCNST